MIALISGTLTRPFTVKFNGGGEFKGRVRLATVSELNSFHKRISELKDDDKTAEYRAKFYADHIKEWNVDGEITTANMLLLPAPVWNCLGDVIAGYEGGEEVLGNFEDSSKS